jgi:hypothetical protein
VEIDRIHTTLYKNNRNMMKNGKSQSEKLDMIKTNKPKQTGAN